MVPRYRGLTQDRSRQEALRQAGERLVLSGERLLGALADDPDQPPPFGLGYRPGFHDLDHVAEMRLVGLVVDVADCPAAHQLAVLGVRDQPLDHDPARLVHLV